jgi:Lar family restriction alleviation protein
MTDKIELMPCPFCGGDAAIRDDKYFLEGVFYGCNTFECDGSSLWEASGAEAIAAWNTRADSAEVISLRAEVAKCHANIKLKADFIDATINQASADNERIDALHKRVEAADSMAELIEPYVNCVVATEGGNSYALRAALAAYSATGAA